MVALGVFSIFSATRGEGHGDQCFLSRVCSREGHGVLLYITQ